MDGQKLFTVRHVSRNRQHPCDKVYITPVHIEACRLLTEREVERHRNDYAEEVSANGRNSNTDDLLTHVAKLSMTLAEPDLLKRRWMNHPIWVNTIEEWMDDFGLGAVGYDREGDITEVDEVGPIAA